MVVLKHSKTVYLLCHIKKLKLKCTQAKTTEYVLYYIALQIDGFVVVETERGGGRQAVGQRKFDLGPT